MSNVVPFSGDDFPSFGTFPDGTPYATSRGLAAMCGVDESTIRSIGQYIDIDSVKSNTREAKIANNLVKLAYDSNQLYYSIVHNNVPINAYPESVCIAILKYYSSQAGTNCTEKADELTSLLMKKSFRDFVYELVGYQQTPKTSFSTYVLSRILHHHDVDDMPLPDGYFCLFDKMIEILQKFDLRIDYQLRDQWFDVRKGDNRFLEPDISLGLRFTQLFTSDYKEAQKEYEELYQSRLNNTKIRIFWSKDLINAKWELDKALAERDLRIQFLKIEGIQDSSLPIPRNMIPRQEYRFKPSPDSNRKPEDVEPAFCYPNDYTSLFHEWLKRVFFKFVWRKYILERDEEGWMKKYNKFKSLPAEKQKLILQTSEGQMISGFEYRQLWENQLPPAP